MATQVNLELKNLLPALARTESANGTSVDLQGYVNPGRRQMKAYLDTGAVSGTTPTQDVKIQESADDSTFTDVSGATFAQQTTTGSEAIHFRTNKRYVRAVTAITGGTPSFTSGCYLLVEKRLT